MWIAIIVFVVSVANIGFIAYKYWNDSHRYDEIATTAFDRKGGSLAEMGVDWDALRAINPEVVAWVWVPGTRISYPVCWCGDNEKYLDMNFDGAAGVFTGAGTVFLDGDAKPDFSCQSSFLFGHHMNDGSMFAALSGFADQGEFDKSRTIYLLTPKKNYEFRTFALVRTVGTDDLVAHEFASADAFEEYVEDKESRSPVQPEEGFPAIEDVYKIIALSTCDYNEADGRAILYGYVVDQATPSDTPVELVGDGDGYQTPDKG